MKKNSAKKAIALYYILSLLLMLVLLLPILLIEDSLWFIFYFVCFYICMDLVLVFVVRVTVMPSLWKELDAEKYAAIISAPPFRHDYSFKLNLCFAIGDYQAAHNIISSILIHHKNVQQRVYGHLLLCRICFERGDYEVLKENIDRIDSYLKSNPNLKIKKQNKEAYEFYRNFSDADYVSVCALLEKGIAKYSKKKNGAYISLLRHYYQLAVTKRMMGDVDEATVLFENIKEKAPKLVLSTLAQKQLDIISGACTEELPEKLEITENYHVKSTNKWRIVGWIIFCVGCLLMIVSFILPQLDKPKQENKNLDYIATLESSIEDDYEEYQILGYFNIYTDYADETYSKLADALFLVESNGQLDLHTSLKSNGRCINHLNVTDIQVDKLYEYEIYFSPRKVEFVLTEKKRNIPENTLYYYEIDGYYFCVISISDIGSFCDDISTPLLYFPDFYVTIKSDTN